MWVRRAAGAGGQGGVWVAAARAWTASPESPSPLLLRDLGHGQQHPEPTSTPPQQLPSCYHPQPSSGSKFCRLAPPRATAATLATCRRYLSTKMPLLLSDEKAKFTPPDDLPTKVIILCDMLELVC